MYQNTYMNPYSNNYFGQSQQQCYYPQNMVPTQMSGPNNQQIQQSLQQIQPVQQSPTLLGKVVDGIDVVRGIDQPIGQSGIYPTADGSAVYVKAWNPDGTTRIDEYKKAEQPVEQNSLSVNHFDEILNKLECLDKKIDGMKPSSPTTRKKKIVEVDEDE